MKITNQDIGIVHLDYRNNIFLDYCKNKAFMPTMVCILEDLWSAFVNMFKHNITNFNTCISLHPMAFVSSGALDMIVNPNQLHEWTLWVSPMSKWLEEFAKMYGLEPQFDYMYFFNMYGEATLYLNLSDDQLEAIKVFFTNEYDNKRLTHRWSYEQFNGSFLEHMVDLLKREDAVREQNYVLACYALRTKEEKQHKRQCTFSLLPLRTDIMQNFVRECSFDKPLIRVSFEYKLNPDIVPVDILVYSSWADVMSQSLRLFLLVFDLPLITRTFTVVWKSSSSVFVDFYFEHEFKDKLAKELLHNFSIANFVSQLEPNGTFVPELESVTHHDVIEVQGPELLSLLPKENIAFYSLFAIGDYERVSLRNYSYLYCKGATMRGSTFVAFNAFFYKFLDILHNEKFDNPAIWFKPRYVEIPQTKPTD